MRAPATTLPEPSAAARAASEVLRARIHDRIAAAGGWLSFAQYMQAALYEPSLGYYSGGSIKFGQDGDFITAPELGDLFARALVATVAPMLASVYRPSILEIGAGTGRLAAQLLNVLDEAGIALDRYVILEPSAELRERQQQTLARFGGSVAWVDTLDGLELEGLIVANEVADALPVERFRKVGRELRALGVESRGQHFAWALGSRLTEQRCAVEPELVAAWPDAYESEYRPLLGPWIASLAACLVRGALVIVDYGLPRREYFHSMRSSGTLTCHYRHRVHDDPFSYPGLQDITAWVDFTSCAEAAAAAGLSLAGFTPQGGWLLEALAGTTLASAELSPATAAQLRMLVLPGEMGERFKLMALTRNVVLDVPGRDLRNWL